MRIHLLSLFAPFQIDPEHDSLLDQPSYLGPGPAGPRFLNFGPLVVNLGPTGPRLVL
mgnify:CR=1 FL=1